MIKLKNVEAVGFTTPAMMALFNDQERTFPMQDAFLISDAIEIIRTRLAPYFKKQKSIIEENQGVISQEGRVTYPKLENQLKATEQINELGLIELEYPIKKITPSPEWPNLTLTEAAILKPILNQNGKGEG